MCIYIIIFYPSMDADSTTIVDQVSKNQFSGEMVITLLLQIIIMVIDRYIYKSKSFVESKDEIVRDKVLGVRRNTLFQHEQDRVKLKRDFSSSIRSSWVKKEDAGGPLLKTTLDQLLAKTEVDFKSVMKLYFQWFVILFTHGLLFFFLPINGNLKYTNQGYCSVNLQPGEVCNAFNSNWYIMLFYVLSCVYLWISAL